MKAVSFRIYLYRKVPCVQIFRVMDYSNVRFSLHLECFCESSKNAFYPHAYVNLPDLLNRIIPPKYTDQIDFLTIFI